MTDRKQHNAYLGALMLLIAFIVVSGCRSVKHFSEGQYLLRKNKVTLKNDKIIYNKGEIKDNLSRLVVQKPNKYIFASTTPLALWHYNARYNKLHNRPDSLLGNLTERPVIFDSLEIPKTILNMRTYLFNQGYFYAKIRDTVTYKNKKAYVEYKINAGDNYLINKIINDIDDSSIADIVRKSSDFTTLTKNKGCTYGMLEEEQSRVTLKIRNQGYYKFSQDNIRFELDTMDKTFFRDVENPLENAINFIASAKSNKKPTLDVNLIIRTRDDSSNIRYRIKNVYVYPDYESQADRMDTSMVRKVIDNMVFKYHKEYIHSKILAERIFLSPGNLYAQDDFDKTIAKLNELAIFQYIRVQIIDNKADSSLNCLIYLNRTKKLDFNINAEVSSGSTYQLGNSAGISIKNKNFEKGADQFMVSLNGGLELSYNENNGRNIIDHFGLLTEYYGVNTSIDFPKFLSPVGTGLFANSNLPHTIISGGSNVVNRVEFFTLLNTSVSYKYNWKKSQTTTWEFAPAFMNIIRLPKESDSFKQRLDSNNFLRDSYRQTFIEGENITYTYTNFDRKQGRNYFRMKLGFEEAGGIFSGVEKLGYTLNDFVKVPYSQYVKFDFDLQRFINFKHSIIAMRFSGGIGQPYGQSNVLPYIKQYYVGGPYSLRGWRIRSLGPGSYYDSTSNSSTLDRTGDIKLEFNGEYRFPILPLFAGTVKMNGAFFTDAGNIWLAQKDVTTPGGEFEFTTLGQDIAMDLGAGARFEIASFLTLRLDVAIPVKEPYISDNYGWVFNKIDFGSSNWRANNIILNISIGYPF